MDQPRCLVDVREIARDIVSRHLSSNEYNCDAGTASPLAITVIGATHRDEDPLTVIVIPCFEAEGKDRPVDIHERAFILMQEVLGTEMRYVYIQFDGRFQPVEYDIVFRTEIRAGT